MNITTKKTISRKAIARHAEKWQSLTNVDELSNAVKMLPQQIRLLSLNPRYRIYQIPKSNGRFRLIEDPHDALKICLRKLNFFLQCSYYVKRPDAAHGFTISAKNDDVERNMVSNARKHLHAAYLFNIDLKDFFHQVTYAKVERICADHFPAFEADLVNTFARLTTTSERLPMGAPTSPVLSNFALYELDQELQKFARASGFTYTRFADDLSFSSQHEITSADIQIIKEAIVHYQFQWNPEKVKLYKPGDLKSVTGIIVGHSLNVPENYISQLQIEIGRLKAVYLVEQRYQTGLSYKKLKLLQQEIQGKLNFIEMVVGDCDARVEHLREQFDKALESHDTDITQSWLDLPYEF